MKKLSLLFYPVVSVLLSCASRSDDMRSSDRNWVDKLVSEYVEKTKNWPTDTYDIEYVQEDGSQDHTIVINIKHRDDARATFPGGGKSIQLHIDVTKRKIVKEYGFQ